MDSSGTAILKILLECGANPMVCCDVGKNCLHDLLWMNRPPPREALRVLEDAIELLLATAGRQGVLSLMLGKDRTGVRR